MEQKINELCNDEKFVEKLSTCNTMEEVAQAFTDAGVELTGEELEAALASVTADAKSGELSENELDDVAGGFFVSGTAFLIGSIIYSVATVASAVRYAKKVKSKKSSKK